MVIFARAGNHMQQDYTCACHIFQSEISTLFWIEISWIYGAFLCLKTEKTACGRDLQVRMQTEWPAESLG